MMKLLASTLAGGRLSSMYLLLVLLLLLESTIVSAFASDDGEGWQAPIRGAGAGLRTKHRAVMDRSKSKSGGSKSGKSKSNAHETGITEGNLQNLAATTEQVVLFSDDFENGWDGWTDGGVNAARIDGSAWGNARSGDWAIRLRHNTAESIITKSINVQAYDKLTMIFYFKPRRMMGAAESFHLDVQTDGGAFLPVQEWTPQDMVDGQFNRGEVDIGVTGINNVIIRFRCVGYTRKDRIFLDDITAIGTQSGGPTPPPTPVPTPMPPGPSPHGPAKFFVLKEQKGDDRFCIGIRESNPDVNDRVVVMKCDRYDDTQKWFVPENDPAYGGKAGRIRSFANQDLCFYANKKQEKEPIRLQRCDRGNDFSSFRHNIVWDYKPKNGGCPDQGDCEVFHTYAEINISNLNSKCKVGDGRTNCHNLCLSYNGNNLDNEDYLRTKNVDLMDKRCEGADREIWAWGWIYQFDDTGDQ